MLEGWTVERSVVHTECSFCSAELLYSSPPSPLVEQISQTDDVTLKQIMKMLFRLEEAITNQYNKGIMKVAHDIFNANKTHTYIGLDDHWVLPVENC